MLVYDKKYLPTVSNLIKNGNRLRIAVAFWGTGSELLFDDFAGKELQLICNLSLGGSNPAVIRKLMRINHAEIRQVDQLHAKILLSEQGVIVGSANMSANGLGFEGGEANSFYELGIYKTDSPLLEEANNWFNSIWNEAKSIDDKDLELAEKAWLKRRGSRPIFEKNKNEKANLMEMDPMELKDRPIYFVFYRYKGSEEAIDYLDEINGNEKIPDGNLDIYEGWGENQLPRMESGIIIPIYIGARRRVDIFPPQRPLPEFRRLNDDVYWDVTINTQESSDVLPFKFSNQDRLNLVEPIKNWFDQCLREEFKKNDYGLSIPIGEFLEWKSNYNQ